MINAHVKVRFWKMNALGTGPTVTLAHLRDILICVLMLLAFLALVISPIFLSLLMPTGS